jgi:hypothetical protein
VCTDRLTDEPVSLQRRLHGPICGERLGAKPDDAERPGALD